MIDKKELRAVKRFVRRMVWRKFIFNVLTHVIAALAEMQADLLKKMREDEVRFTYVPPVPEPEPDPDAGWKRNLAIAEVMNTALGGQDLRKGA